MVSSPQQTNKTRYLILEPRHKKLVLQELYEIAENPRWVYLFSDTEWQGYLKESPVLLEAAQDSAEYRWGLQSLKEESLSGLILESPKGLDVVASWLRARLTVRIEGQRKGLLRFYDPWIWHRLAPQTIPVAEVIERAIYWHGTPGQQRWMITENPEPIVMSPSPTLGEQQWLALNATSA
eukprot:TRINITY_DN9438_c0_g1_i1.p1 TRINITY_DN9438_c0_g1~~TRINITY_DN9438_c0_g1_i1.p1  ORF type:complete len:180 (-),score=8.21 TRINITY_DN9438_c0_g1_i1:28-567(-)